ncbi:DNA polymerase II [Ketobacter alkanivorans]|uniref:DNA polymerase II n=1 Tax=Ketobacter alkanivorans TaxID=1917421 RepID=UPI001F2BB15B|nr:DNA polymerase II [Ketobacter alkanivorans]
MTTANSVLSGFVLTRQWREQADGLRLIYWVYSDQGPVQVTVTGQETVSFFPAGQVQRVNDLLRGSKAGKGWRLRPLALKSFFNEPVHGLYCSGQRTLAQCRDLFDAHGIPLWEADIRTVDRFLSERFITGDIEIHLASSGQVTALTNPPLRRGERNPVALRCASVDIETAMDGSQLYSIAAHCFGGRGQEVKRVFMVGQAQPCTDTDVLWFDHEKALLQAFLRWFQQDDPDVILGWNVVNFDLRFLQKRCDLLRLQFSLGRMQEAPEWRQARDETQHYFVLVPGRVVLDGIDTLKAATWNFESFSLEYVSRQLLERGKLVHDVDNRGDEITELFHNDKPALARYNLEDCCLVSDIFAKADLLNFALERSRLTGLPMDKVGGSVAAFENLFLPRLHREGYVAPNIGELQSDITAPGGYVMQSDPGLYRHVLVLDFKSLYPSIIRTFCIDPLSLLKGRYESDLQAVVPYVYQRPDNAAGSANSAWIPGFNGAVFSKQQHLLPDIIKTLWDARDQAKKVRNAPLSQAIKIIMNSFYGVLGTPLCRFFDPLLSSSITLRGHDIMLQTRQLIEQQGHRVIYGDTDSVFVWLESAENDEEAEQIGTRLAVFLNQWWQHYLDHTFGLESFLELEFETHYQRFFMPTMRGSEAGSKKRYCGMVRQLDGDSGEQQDKLIFKGLENVRTDWTPLARRLQYDVFWMMFHDESPDLYLEQVVQDLLAGKLDEELVYRKRIRRRLVDYQKNVPPHAQAAKKADVWLQQQGRAPRYERGGWVSYVMTVNGPEPMEHHPSALDYDHYLTRQLAPAVDGILQCEGRSLESILRSQMTLF